MKIIIPLFFLSIVLIGSTIIYPLESKMLPVIVSKEDLVKVNSIFQFTYKTLDVFLDAISTIAVTFLGMRYTFVFSGVGFALAWFSYRLTKLKKVTNKKENDTEESGIKQYFADLKEGWQELKRQNELLLLLLPLIFINFFYGIFEAGLPRFFRDYLTNSAIGYGLLLTAGAVGGIFGALLMRFIKLNVNKDYNFITLSCLGAGVSQLLIPFGAVTNSIMSIIGTFLASTFIGMLNIMFMSLVQTIIPENVLGRVSTINESLLSLMIPLGSFVGGLIIAKFNSLVPQIVYGVALISISFTYLYLKKHNNSINESR